MWNNTTLTASLLVALLGLPLASVAAAQGTTATIVGTITDSSGAALPGALVTARNADTGLARSVPAGEAGAYRLEFLPIGNYVVEATLDGFKGVRRSGIVLRVSDTVRVDVSLEIGALAETVTVTGAAPLINTSTAEIGRTIDAAAIAALPLVDRNVYSLLDLTPGVQSNNNGVSAASTGTSSLVLGYPEQRTLINGGADGGTGSVNYYLDGGINMTGLRNTGNILPNPDAIEEVKVQTNSYSVEYGRFASGVINVVTKSGTNDTTARCSISCVPGGSTPRTGDRCSTRRRSIASSSAASPADRSNRNRTFFFASYSGLRQTTSTFMNTAIVPTALERGGDFSASATKPIDPATGQTFVCNGVVGVDLRQSDRPGGREDHQQLHPGGERPGQHLAGLRPEPVRLRRAPGEGRPSDQRRRTASPAATSSPAARTPSRRAPATCRGPASSSTGASTTSTSATRGSSTPAGSTRRGSASTRNFGGRLNLPQTSLADLGSRSTSRARRRCRRSRSAATSR